MKANAVVEIIKVNNGFMVRTPGRMGEIIDFEQTKVFETMTSLVSFIEQHFDWPEKK